MEAPKGYEKVGEGQVCKLKRSLYGLKQASRQWNCELTTQLTNYGFKQSMHDHCLFILNTASCFLVLLVYVDDILLTGDSETKIKKVKQFLDCKFTIKDLEHAKYFLGLEMVRFVNGLYVHKRKYVLDLLQETVLIGCKPALTSLLKGVKFFSNQGELLAYAQQYMRLNGRMLYLGPDISYATQKLSQYVHSSRDVYWQGAMHVLRYLKTYPSLGLFFPSDNSLQVIAYCDSDWGGIPGQ